MDGICRPLGCGVPVTLAGQTFLLSPLTLGAIGVCEQLLLSRRSIPVEIAARMCDRVKDKAIREQILERAHKDMRRDRSLNKVKRDTILEWIDSEEGIEVTAWLCLRKEHPETFMTLEMTRALLMHADDGEIEGFRKLRDQISGMHWFSLIEWPKKLRDAGLDEEEDDDRPRKGKGPQSWRQWVQLLMDEFSYDPAKIRDWTLDMAKAATAPRKKSRSRKEDDDSGADARLNRRMKRGRR